MFIFRYLLCKYYTANFQIFLGCHKAGFWCLDKCTQEPESSVFISIFVWQDILSHCRKNSKKSTSWPQRHITEIFLSVLLFQVIPKPQKGHPLPPFPGSGECPYSSFASVQFLPLLLLPRITS